MAANKPILGTPINWSHPLSRDFVRCLLLNEGSGNAAHDLVAGDKANFVADSKFTVGKTGSAIAFDGTDDLCLTELDTNPKAASGVVSSWRYGTVAMLVFPREEADGGYMGSGIGSDDKLLSIRWDAPQRMTATVGSNGRWGRTDSSDGTVVQNKWVHLSMTFALPTVMVAPDIYVNGILDNASQQVSDPANRNEVENHQLYIASGSKGPANCIIDHVMIWDRVLLPQEITQLYLDPFAMFRQEPIWFFFQEAAPVGGIPIFRRRIERYA